MIRGLFFLAWFLAGSMVQAKMEVLPSGWRYPQDLEDKGVSGRVRNLPSHPFHVRGDFDGNGHIDEAWILIHKGEESKLGLFVFLNRGNLAGKGQPLFLSGGSLLSSFRVELVPPGQYQTACGKGYWPCGADEPAILELKNPGMRVVFYEKASEIYYWNESTAEFKTVAESD